MSLAGSGAGCMTKKQKHIAHLCNLRKQVSSSERNNDLQDWRGDSRNKRRSSSFVEENDYSASFHLDANSWLPFWLCLVTSSYFLLRDNINFFSSSRVKYEENVSLHNKSIPNERRDNINDATAVDDALSYSEGSGSPHSTCSSTYYDVFSEISDFDRTSYRHSLLSLEEEDIDWVSADSMTPENPSTPLSYIGDSFSEISDIGTPSYRDYLLKLKEEDSDWILDKASYSNSLLSLEEEDSEWLSGSMISENPYSPLSLSGDSFSKISDIGLPSYWESLIKLDEDNVWILDRASYTHSLLSLEEEDSAWLSDSMIHEGPSSPLSYNGDSFTDISNGGTPSYWDSLLRLEEEDNKWISDSKQELKYVQDGSPISSYKINWGIEVLPSVSTISSFIGTHCGKSEDAFSAEHLLETTDIEELNGDEPLFWPFEGEFNWDSEESSFCSSPSKRLVFDSRSTASRIKGDEQKGDEDFDSRMDIPLEYFDLDKECAIETLVGLKEFDGHEGLDSEFIGDGFMLEESL
ncbi:hypothetical protein MTR_2g098610 [Medicago truncatula]|nr:hypothetical protein MTR_2g098610 [Medicago truncatula]